MNIAKLEDRTEEAVMCRQSGDQRADFMERLYLIAQKAEKKSLFLFPASLGC